jgi:hypothetical protein
MKTNWHYRFIYFLFLTSLILNIPKVYSDDVIDAIEEEDRLENDVKASGTQAPGLVNETIKRISPSKKIFILTNEGQSFSKGDFISLLSGNQLVCRALVAKLNSGLSGIKIIKIYNMKLWNQLSPNKEVLVLKGDDSYYNTKDTTVAKDKDPKDKKTKDKDLKIQSDDDLYNTTVMSDDESTNVDEASKRLIKPDNLLGLKYALIQGIDNSGASVKYPHVSLDWAYQIGENIWAEAGVGYNTIRDYPNVNTRGGLDTMLLSGTFRIKYTISAPFYSYVQPYIGYQYLTANSPGAGQQDPKDIQLESNLQKEIQLVDDLKRNGPVFGVTLLRRIVPGWFARVDLGSDLLSGGLTLEF